MIVSSKSLVYIGRKTSKQINRVNSEEYNNKDVNKEHRGEVNDVCQDKVIVEPILERGGGICERKGKSDCHSLISIYSYENKMLFS